MLFDGSDVGITGELDAFHLLNANTVLFSLAGTATLPGNIAVQDRDIIQLSATSLGNTTAGTLSVYFDGDDVGLTQSSEDIDAFEILPDGRIVISTLGSFSVPGISGTDEDLIVFTPTILGANTSGTWAMYFDGSDVGLSGGEDVDAVGIAANGALYLSTDGEFIVTTTSGATIISGSDEDIFFCTPITLGPTTACTFSPTLAFDGSSWGLAADDVDAIGIP